LLQSDTYKTLEVSQHSVGTPVLRRFFGKKALPLPSPNIGSEQSVKRSNASSRHSNDQTQDMIEEKKSSTGTGTSDKLNDTQGSINTQDGTKKQSKLLKALIKPFKKSKTKKERQLKQESQQQN
tara:strand:+ start:799 stop:1170 length:372 start_codon:yes stop_codon:yes gene_type:complete